MTFMKQSILTCRTHCDPYPQAQGWQAGKADFFQARPWKLVMNMNIMNDEWYLNYKTNRNQICKIISSQKSVWTNLLSRSRKLGSPWVFSLEVLGAGISTFAWCISGRQVFIPLAVSSSQDIPCVGLSCGQRWKSSDSKTGRKTS